MAKLQSWSKNLPSIVSGDTVAFLDPHEKYFVRGQPGQAFSMQDDLLQENHDQFEPFHKIFDCSISKGNYFSGTLFRFPLRIEPSELSSKIYTKPMVMSLFGSLQNEASVILHFLKNVDSIKLYELQDDGTTSFLFSVKVPDEAKDEIRRKRKELTENITSDWDFSVKSVFYTLEVVEEQEGKASLTKKWFVANQVGTEDKKLIALGKDLKLLPWIGIAFPVDKNIDGASHNGRIFCFLPLPPDADCRTGLPVQFNGYFGLTDNRRSLKWPGPDCQNDNTAEWNQRLLRVVGSNVYASLIENMIKICPVQTSQLPTYAELIYSAIPKIQDVKEDWLCLLEPFFRKVLKKNIFYTTAAGKGAWINLGKAILDRFDQSGGTGEDVKQAILRFLIDAGQPIVTVPENVLKMIDNYSLTSGWQVVKQVTPHLVRYVLRLLAKDEERSVSIATEDKLLLLQYVLQDMPENASDLHGVPLLPLENGEFCAFQEVELSCTFVRKVFIPNTKHSAGLLPCANHRLLRENIPQSLKEKLVQLTNGNQPFASPTQLFKLTRDDVPQLLWQSFPNEWDRDQPTAQIVVWSPGDPHHPPVSWLPLIWEWIVEQYPSNLSHFEGMPLIPLFIQSYQYLGRLHQSGMIIGKHSRFRETLTLPLREFLTASGCIVIEELPSYVSHQQIFDYVAPPTADGLLKMLMVCKRGIASRLESARDELKTQLRGILSKLTYISAEARSFLVTLPIFKALDKKTFLACWFGNEKLPIAPPNFFLPEGIQLLDHAKIISSSEEVSFQLLRKLGMAVESTASLLMKRLERYLTCTGYSYVEKNKLMVWVLDKMEILEEDNPTLADFLSQLPFVPTSSGKRRSPSQMFDHTDEVLCQLLVDNSDAFPVDEFSEAMRKRKDHLGVRSRGNLTPQDLLEISNTKPSTPQNGLKKGVALLNLLNQRPGLLSSKLPDGTFLSYKLSTIRCLPRLLDRPEKYPDFMPWYDGDQICKPQNMCPSSLALLVGASVPLVDEKCVNKKVQDAFGISKNYALSRVVKQLELAIDSWNQQRSEREQSRMELMKFQDLLKEIYLYFSKNTSDTVKQFLDQAHLSNWVWHGYGFCRPEKLAIMISFPSNIRICPHLFLLPQEFRILEDFFLSLGVKKEFNDVDLIRVLESIKEKHDNAMQNVGDVIQDLDSCRLILEWIIRDGEKLSDEIQNKLLIPVQTHSGQLRLQPCNSCTFCDRDFLKLGGSEDDVTSDFHLIHEAIPNHLAVSLGVPRLSSCLAEAEPLEYEIEEAGQFEPLTTRLHNILQEYKEGIAIFKELIQNADDAGASEVCFVVDWRDNPGEKLLSQDMAKCQGPALWAYNNAVFSKQDFENINKLAGETKKDELDKIGRFGLGFNAVYHITDVPSFVSAEYFVVFDPNMNHIFDVIKKGSRPGLKINLAKSPRVLSLFSDQFLPYHSLFGCNTRNNNRGTFYYDGTLFRFPLRTKDQAEQSDISQNYYSRGDLHHVLESVKESSSTLLLFAQNVNHVRVFEIENGSDPKNGLGEPVISISKGVEKVLCSNYVKRSSTESFLRCCFNWWKQRVDKSPPGTEDKIGPRLAELLKISVHVKKCKLTNCTKSTKLCDTWLVNSCTGSSRSVKLAESKKGRRHGLLPICGTAIRLSFHNSCDGVSGVGKIHSVAGEVFSFLPLSFSSGLPVHVNGYFSVLSNRRGIWEEGVGDHDALKPFEAQWNAALMEDPLVIAYIQLLELIQSYADEQYVFYSLWPNPNLTTHTVAWKPLMDAFFGKIIDERKPLFYCNEKWRALQDCFILEFNLSKVSECLAIMNFLGIAVLSLPEYLLQAFKSSGKTATITKCTLTREKFLREYFFPNITKIPKELRKSVICHVLELRLSKHENYDDLFQLYPCFSCSRDDCIFRKPSELVHPRGQAACLFSEEEKVFPLEECFLTKERVVMLEDLGMVVDTLSWSGICERAEWISSRGSMGLQRAIPFVKYLVRYLETQSSPKPMAEHKSRLRVARFLPVMSKPKEYPLFWKGSGMPFEVPVAADSLYPEKLKFLVGSSQIILDESSPDFGSLKSLMKVLGLTSKQPQLADVLAQLDHVINYVNTAGAPEIVKVVCVAIYDYFKKIATRENQASNRATLHKELSRRPWMLVKGHMVNPKFVAMKWNKEDGSPYLYSLPEGYKTRYFGLVKWYGVKETFTSDDFLQAIRKLKVDTKGEKLSEQQISVMLNFLHEICTIYRDQNLRKLDIVLPLPSTDCRLYDSAELAYNDAPLIECDASIQYVHTIVPLKVALQCGAKNLRTAVLSNCSEPIGQPFGQREMLTDRLSGILKSYPADEGILKELVQNADDAKASEIHFVFDPRIHNYERIFSEEWKQLQGPAICVYNDQVFSQADISGIQNLGIGSKVNDSEKTGQYGIGFNAVYHLTDCPCFLSDDRVLCVSDPHRWYVPGATQESPGRLFHQLDDKFRRNFQGVMSGFLGEFFTLKGGTMFRLPLRRRGALQSKISENYFDADKVRSLFELFRKTAKEMLLFLNNVKKISISEIKNDKIESYSVSCTISDEVKRSCFSQVIKKYKKTATRNVPWYITHYVMTTLDSNKVMQEWLVAQSLGYQDYPLEDSSIPDGAKWGLLPRAGIAARLSSRDECFQPPPFRHRVFCFLPLPVTTSLPVHVNGHFALDSARRDLWHDPKAADERSVWNEFLIRHAVAPAYASLILEARAHLKGHHKLANGKMSFSSELDADVGLMWYHNLFPSIGNATDKWKAVEESFYSYLSRGLMPVLPVAQSIPQRKCSDYLAFLRPISSIKTRTVAKSVIVDWCSVDDVYFTGDEDKELRLVEKTLLDIGLPLLSHTPSKIYAGFKSSGCAKQVSPDAAMEFLRSCLPLKEKLPQSVKNTPLLSVRNVVALVRYCSSSEEFFGKLQDLPLLLTQDEVLRCFNIHASVFCSRFSDLLPSRSELFLHEHVRSSFQSNLEKCAGIVEAFDLVHLSKFKDDVFPADWTDDTVHRSWEPTSQTNLLLSKKWLKLLWSFINSLSSTKKQVDILQIVATWPIIPTTQNNLAPVMLAKTVLNISSHLNSDSTGDRKRRELLMKLNCPQLESTMMPIERFLEANGLVAVLKHYLALIQSPADVLCLLDHTLNKNDEEREINLNDMEIHELLMFLQTESSSLSDVLLKNLPFYKTCKGNYTRLPCSRRLYQVPDGFPVTDFDILSEVANCVFLNQAPMLRILFQHVGIKEVPSHQFYMTVVLKHFQQLTPLGRECHLVFIRDTLIPCLPTKEPGYLQLIDTLKQLPFIPDESGLLQPACKFYDLKNKVFVAFLPAHKFPPAPFNSHNWTGFLHKVGLQTTVTQEHFEEYAMRLAREVSQPNPEHSNDDVLHKMSKTLVSCLFETPGLQNNAFLQKISNIRFVPAAKIKQEFLAIHQGYSVQHKSTKSSYIPFRGSVISDHTSLVWSSAPLLSPEAKPTGKNRSNLMRYLGIHATAPHGIVLSHAKNISYRFNSTKEKQVPSVLRFSLCKVMESIYNYFKACCSCSEPRLKRGSCSQECLEVSDALHTIPIILIDQHIFLRGNQLAFHGVSKSIEPFMFNVPRVLGQYEHFLERLGAQEYPTPYQYATVLEAVKNSCEDNEMHPVERRTTTAAVSGLFLSLKNDSETLNKVNSRKFSASQSLTNVRILYLPTEDGHLKASTELLVNDSMEPKDRLKQYWRNLLKDFTVMDEPACKLVELLPPHLKVQKLSGKVDDRLNPDCTHKLCVLESDRSTQRTCAFIQRYRRLMCSIEFSDALIRLFKHQEKLSQVPGHVKKSLKVMETCLSLRCMQAIETRLVSQATDEPIPGSEREVGCFCQEERGDFQILIKHGEGESNNSILHDTLSSFIHKITGRFIKEANWRFLIMMLGAKEAAEIPGLLDSLRIPRSLIDSWKEPTPGETIPKHFHFLLNSDIDYYLREGELVGYELDEEDENNDPIYVHAKIIEQTRDGEGKFRFDSRYKIDIGKDKPIEVRKTRLYKFDRGGTKLKKNTDASSTICGDIVPYENSEESTTEKSENDNTQSKPKTLEEAKREVAEALKEIWNLPESERTGAIRRLMRRWHPDKNLDCESLANEVIKFLQNEVERLRNDGVMGYRESHNRPRPDCRSGKNNARSSSRNSWNEPDFSEFFTRFREQTRRERRRYEEWRENGQQRTETEPRNDNEAARWMRQAQEDLNAAKYLFDSQNVAFFTFTCFHCHQAVEKSIKALLFSKGRIEKTDLECHEVLSLAYRAAREDPSLRSLPNLVKYFHDYYKKTRYPEYKRYSTDQSIPSGKYTDHDAHLAISKTEEILALFRNILKK